MKLLMIRLTKFRLQIAAKWFYVQVIKSNHWRWSKFPTGFCFHTPLWSVFAVRTSYDGRTVLSSPSEDRWVEWLDEYGESDESTRQFYKLYYPDLL